ncbi:predicted protein [Naegleria gruberi]|uniref:Predicted protein n=1 Tax=Naegleria gruberi TaxID=5762 RepID=D2VVD5_NAEGR|nr:uncharacterized protein NAEGRDRAFT_52559 [Naegleria gruberi]EFC39292.1 predicted protein [Naegleria gruberi]|eukprot:XP_002672036.1 predicted protein [Naegleria gruberi strain NEG-M]
MNQILIAKLLMKRHFPRNQPYFARHYASNQPFQYGDGTSIKVHLNYNLILKKMEEFKQEKSGITLPHHSTWLNGAVLFNIYSFLPLHEVLTFRLVNQAISEELHISSSSTDPLFFMNRLSKIKIDLEDKSCEFFHGCLLKINAEIRNCMICTNDDSYFDYLFENDEHFAEFFVIMENCDLFKSGRVSFNSFIGGIFSQAQGGRAELKILKKSNQQENDIREFMIFSQHFVYGPNTRTYNLERFYELTVRDSNNEEKILVQYQNNYHSYEAIGKIDSEAITEVMKELDIPIMWNWEDFLNFLMICAGSKTYNCLAPFANNNSNVMESMIKELGSIEEISYEEDEEDDNRLKSESDTVKEGLKYLEEEILTPIIQSDLRHSQRMEYFHYIRREILKHSARKSQNLFSFDSVIQSPSYDISINEFIFQAQVFHTS